MFDNVFSGVQRTDIKPQSKHYMSVVLRRIAKYQRELAFVFRHPEVAWYGPVIKKIRFTVR